MKLHGRLLIGNHRPNALKQTHWAPAFLLAGRFFRTSVSREAACRAMLRDPEQSRFTPERASHLRYDAIER
jgi:hypothetical protein